MKPGAGALPDTTGSRSRATEGGRCRSASSNEFQIFRPQAPCRSVDRERYSIARLQFCAVRHVHGVYVDVRLGCFVAVNSGEAKFGKIVTPSSPVGARSSTRCGRLRSSSKAGGITTTPSTRMLRSATGHPHRKSSCLHSPRGRLRYADRPSQRKSSKGALGRIVCEADPAIVDEAGEPIPAPEHVVDRRGNRGRA